MSQNLGSFKLAKLLQNNVLPKILWDFSDVCLNAPSFGRFGELIQQPGFTEDPGGVFHQFKVHPRLGSNSHTMRDVNQQLDQVVRDFLLPLAVRNSQALRSSPMPAAAI